MDKYNLVLDIIEHPEKYTAERLKEILSDPKVREIYNLLCKTDSAIEYHKELDVNAEWNDFSRSHMPHSRRWVIWSGSRVASIAAIACTSVVAIAVTISVMNRKPLSEKEVEYMIPSGIMAQDTVVAQTDTTKIMFENESLEVIMKSVASLYGVEVMFRHRETASLHLYYKLDTALSLDEVISQLNTFEQINIKRNGNMLTID